MRHFYPTKPMVGLLGRSLLTAGLALASLSASAALSGSYTINAGGSATATNYKSVGAAISDMTSGTRSDGGPAQGSGISASVTFSISNGSYTGPFSIGTITGASATKTITFKSATGAASLCKFTRASAGNATNNHTLQLNAGRWLRFENLTIERTGSSQYGAAVSLTGGSHNNIFKGCVIAGSTYNSGSTPGSTSWYSAAVISKASTNTQDTANTFDGCDITSGNYGFFAEGTSANRDKGWLINNCDITGCNYYGIWTSYTERLQITGNRINSLLDDDSRGISTDNGLNTTSISNNEIYGGAWGIYITSATTGTGKKVLISGNMISLDFVTLFEESAGIYDDGNSTADYVFNSIYQGGFSLFYLHKGIHLSSSATTGTVRILNNVIDMRAQGPFLNIQGTSRVSEMDYNCLYSNATFLPQHGEWGGTGASNFNNWRTTTGKDAHSISIAAPFADAATDLHITDCRFKNRGTQVSTVAADLDGDPHDAFPDIGADEYDGVPGEWVGALSSDWADAQNWCDDTEPTCAASTDVTIPYISIRGATTNYPAITAGTGSCRDLTIENNAALEMYGGTLNVCRHITANGDFLPYDGTVNLSGTVNQNIDGISFWNLGLTGNSTKKLQGDVTVYNNLTCTSGKLNTQDYQVTLGSDGQLTESTSSYVVGYITTSEEWSSTGVTYDANGLGVSVNAAAVAPGTTTITRYTGDDAIQVGQEVSGGTQNESIKRYYDIDPTVDNGLNATLTMRWLNNEINGIAESELTLYKSEDGGTTWNFVGHDSRNTGTNTISKSGINSFSRWTLGSSITPLPVELISFSAEELNPQDALLKWATASELVNDRFEIERSTDGLNWEALGQVQGNGTSAEIHHYTYIDKNALTLPAPRVFYRLRQVDFDGQSEHSPVVMIELRPQAPAIMLSAWPNPVQAGLQIDCSNLTDGMAVLRITDLNGRVMLSQKFEIIGGEGHYTIPVGSLQPGLYTLGLITDKVTTVQFLKN